MKAMRTQEDKILLICKSTSKDKRLNELYLPNMVSTLYQDQLSDAVLECEDLYN
ncbi:UNVERIFIED_CONTAM: hypothetical protein K2H54_008298, partial [Gekko kuhli]